MGRAIERDALGESPLVSRTINPDVLRPRLHTERVEQPMVVVGIAVELVNGNVNLVRALDEIEAGDREEHLSVAENAHGLEFLDARVRAVTADAFRVEDSNPNHEVLILDGRPQPDPNRQWFAAVKHVSGLLVRATQLNIGDLDFS